MDRQYIDALHLISAAIHSKKININEISDPNAAIHECFGQNCELISLSAAISAEGAPALENFDSMKTYLKNKKIKETLRAVAVAKLLRTLEAAGCRPIVIKGAALAQLYPDPYLRESVDADLYFTTAAERDRAQSLLLERGGTLKQAGGDKHNSLTYPGVGTVELHKSLCGDEFQKLHLKDRRLITEPFRRISGPAGAEITTLGLTDTVKYTFIHMMGHFLFSRCDLKQLCDVLLCVSTCKNDLDLDALYAFLRDTGYFRAYETVLSAGIKYLDFDPADLTPINYAPETAERFISDCFNGCARGVWGKTSLPRGSGIFSYNYNEEKFSGEKPALRRQMLSRVIRGVFPKKSLLTAIYPYCSRRPVLLPVAWANNLLDLASGVLSHRGTLDARAPLLRDMELL